MVSVGTEKWKCMASLDRQLEAKAEKIKAFIEEECESRDIEIEEIVTTASYPYGEVSVLLENSSSYNLGRINAFVKSKWPDIESEAPRNYLIEFHFTL